MCCHFTALAAIEWSRVFRISSNRVKPSFRHAKFQFQATICQKQLQCKNKDQIMFYWCTNGFGSNLLKWCCEVKNQQKSMLQDLEEINKRKGISNIRCLKWMRTTIQDHMILIQLGPHVLPGEITPLWDIMVTWKNRWNPWLKSINPSSESPFFFNLSLCFSFLLA